MEHKIIEKKIDTSIWDDPIPVIPEEIPVLDGADYLNRIKRLWDMPQAAKYDTIIVYGDREHFSNVEYFTSYDPRWEETLLILSRDRKPCILVGNEGMGYVKRIPYDIDVKFYQTFSLMGQPNEDSDFLRDILKKEVKAGDRKIGIIGFKYYIPSKHTLSGLITDVPHYIIETLCQVVPAESLENATYLMADCEFGLKHSISAKEAVLYEVAGTRVSRGVLNCLKNLKPGMSEMEASLFCQFDGAPANMHPNINFGENNVALGLNSPTDQETLHYGDPVGIGFGRRGSLVHKCGMYLRDKQDLPEDKAGYMEDLLIPYFNNVVSWYEMMKIGTPCGSIYDMVDTELGLKAFGCGLNPGHLTHTDEWTNSPFEKGNTVPLHSGMAFQCDYTVTKNDPFMSAHVEDGLLLADAEMRKEIAALSKSCMERIERRRKFIIEELHIQLPEEVLPLSDLSCVCFPYMADLSVVLACE